MKKQLLAVLLLASRTVLHGQTVGVPIVRVVDDLLGQPVGLRYYDKYWVPLPAGPEGAHCYDRFTRIDSAGLNWQARRYMLATGRLILEQYFTGLVPGIELEGHSREWYETGQLREELTYHKSQTVGVLRTYHPNGKLCRNQLFTSGKGTSTCYDSTGQALAKCPPYHTFAQLKGKNTYSGRFLKLVQQEYKGFLPAGYQQPKELLVYYAFRIDPTGAVQDARLLTDAPAALQAAILKAINQLPAFEPAVLEGQPTNDVVEGVVQAKVLYR
ncbi:toxin-antitoxin system YwqK family antitoxin [Hymenobacter terricola]|uniref:hypothetical protein n=1 Tax=Hymenobacter terricola TaxID=2819236 RepID=UPI001B30BCB5|nr:hypothetical protein [Hymenobacter terricola]